jgi:major membrane immunogen (membrane-anchored lipoprotein)
VVIRKFCFILISIVLLSSCGKKDDVKTTVQDKNTFVWTDALSLDKIPDSPVQGMMNGKEFKVEYINFEVWRGSDDHVINFTAKAPRQNCGAFEDNDSGFRLTKKSGEFKPGDFIKDKFTTSMEGVVADYHFSLGKDNTKNVTPDWNCVFTITEINDKTVKGKIAICFKDESKSWIAGTFEAIKCIN